MMGKNGIRNKILELWKRNCSVEEENVRVIKAEEDIRTSFTKMAYHEACRAEREKRGELLVRADAMAPDLAYCVLPYNRHCYLKIICQRIVALIAEVADMERSQVSAALAFRHGVHSEVMDKSWKWMSDDKYEAERIVQDSSMVQSIPFRTVQENFDGYVYIRERENNGFENQGSDLYMRVNFDHMGRDYMEGVLIISTFGKTFQEKEEQCAAIYGTAAEDRFERILAYEVLPYFKYLLQAELGQYYTEERVNFLEEQGNWKMKIRK